MKSILLLALIAYPATVAIAVAISTFSARAEQPREVLQDPSQAPPSGAEAPRCVVDGKELSQDRAAMLGAIHDAPLCWQAVQLAEGCASGSSGDTALTKAALPVCIIELENHKPGPREREILESMKTACEEQWTANEGQSVLQKAFCELKAVQAAVELTAGN
jgi:hypothetical protein